MEYHSRSVRLDDEVWRELEKSPLSANQLLRVGLGLDEGAKPRRQRVNRTERLAVELQASDVTAQLAERDNIEYGHHETLPKGEHVATMRQREWKPLLRPSEKKR